MKPQRVINVKIKESKSKTEIGKNDYGLDITKMKNNDIEALLRETESKYNIIIQTSYTLIEQLLLPEYARTKTTNDCFNSRYIFEKDPLDNSLFDEYVDTHYHKTKKVELGYFVFKINHCDGFVKRYSCSDGDFYGSSYEGSDKLSIVYNKKPVFDAIIYKKCTKNMKMLRYDKGEWQERISELYKNIDKNFKKTIIDIKEKFEIEEKERRIAKKAELLRMKKEKTHKDKHKELLEKAECLKIFN